MAIEVKIRDTEKEDVTFLNKWLSYPKYRKAYMPENDQEAEICASIWMAFAGVKASLTATVDGEPVGMATLQFTPFKKIQHQSECSIIVSPEYQRSGVGTTLMENLVKMAKERFKLEFIFLHIYEGADSIKFYKKLGFTKFGEQKKWIKDPETGKYLGRIWMERQV